MIRVTAFDLDGVLVDADTWHFEALNLALADHALPEITWEEHLTIYKGIPTRTKMGVYAERHGLDSPVPKTVEYGKQFWTKQFIQFKCKPVREIQNAVRMAYGRGRVAVVSNAIRETVEQMLTLAGLMPWVDYIVSNEDAPPKPDPSGYLKVAEHFSIYPEEMLVVEDSEVGKAAAYASGAFVCEVTDPSQVNWPRIAGCIKSSERVTVVIPAAGAGKRFAEAGHVLPKPLIDVQGKPMLQHVLDNVDGVSRHPIVIAQKEHIDRYAMQRLFPDVSFVQTHGMTQGAAETVLTAYRYVDQHELLLLNSDQLILEGEIEEMVEAARRQRLDGMIMAFQSDGDPKWSYAEVFDGLVTQVAEKKPLWGNWATTGVYWFRKGTDFVDAARAMIRKDIRTNGEFYVAPAFNELIAEGKRIGMYVIEPSRMKGLGTPEDLNAFLGVPA